MANVYKKPEIIIASEAFEGVFAASGSGSLTVNYLGVWDRWTGGGKGYCSAEWNGINGTITLTLNFNIAIDQVETDNSGTVSTSVSGQTATLTFQSSLKAPLTIGVHVNNGSSIDSLSLSDYSYSVN